MQNEKKAKTFLIIPKFVLRLIFKLPRINKKKTKEHNGRKGKLEILTNSTESINTLKAFRIKQLDS